MMLALRIALFVAVILVLAACGAALAGPDGVTDGTTLPPTTTSVPPDPTTTLSSVVTPGIVSVPDLTGLTLTEAILLAGDTGLEVIALPQAINEATVVAQEPAQGAEVQTGTVITVDVQAVPTCNPPDPLAPSPGQVIITVLFECGGEVIAPTPGIGVPRIVPESDRAVDRIERTLRSMLAGPTADEKAVGFDSAFDEGTAEALNSATLTGGRLVIDFNEAILVNNMNTSTGMVFFNAEVRRNVFLHPEVDTVEFHLNGECAAWSALFESDGCWDFSRADWDQDLAAWDQARNQ